ncbi:MAG: hypothetical protein V7711_15865 [Pseudomonadales bacterium]
MTKINILLRLSKRGGNRLTSNLEPLQYFRKYSFTTRPIVVNQLDSALSKYSAIDDDFRARHLWVPTEPNILIGDAYKGNDIDNKYGNINWGKLHY